MKKLIRCLFLLPIILVTIPLQAQLDIQITDCNNILARLASNHEEINYTFWLEKQIAPGVWSEQKKNQQEEKQIAYKKLETGTYRIGVVLNNGSKKDKHIKITPPEKILSRPFEIISDCLEEKKEEPTYADSRYTPILQAEY